MRRADRRGLFKGLAFASPFLIGFAVFIAYPIAASFRYSFTGFNLFQDPQSVGLDNYAHMLGDERLWTSLGNTLYITALGVPLTIGIALAGAHVLNLPVRGQPLFRALVYLPTIVPVVVGGYLWRWLLNAQYGFVSWGLDLVGLPAPLWLESPDWSRPAIVLMSLWTVGGTMIIYLAALKDVPPELYEAAAIDGAGTWRRFWHVTWPMLSPITLFQVIVTFIGFLQIFAQPYLLTQERLNTSSGGPADTMLSYSMYLFQNAFVFLKMGYASAMAWMLFLVTLIITALLLLSSRRWVHYGSR
ncbi:sugar ABC transporter permease [Nonomuraea rosea]|uniref:Sugar ABC transporter permease n=1 Tax=Nonomuraea rosea TaxID=638574 RepID=A0ABP6ZVZ5_9ACTN